jgi:hypothetical protein
MQEPLGPLLLAVPEPEQAERVPMQRRRNYCHYIPVALEQAPRLAPRSLPCGAVQASRLTLDRILPLFGVEQYYQSLS